MTESTRGIDWTDDQNDLVVADYFAMLRMQMASQPFVKLRRYDVLSQQIGKTSKAVEAKHQNISAVLERVGEPMVAGLRPRVNFQNSLIAAIERYLSSQLAAREIAGQMPTESRLHLERHIWIGPAPTLVIGPAPVITADDSKSSAALERLIRKFDPVERDNRNRKLGLAGEELVLQHERARLESCGRLDLARKVEWTSQERGDGAGYDILSFNADGALRLIEVKTTDGPAKTPFYLSENERRFSEERPDAFHLLRLHDFSSQPKGFELRPPLEQFVALRPTSYRAEFISSV